MSGICIIAVVLAIVIDANPFFGPISHHGCIVQCYATLSFCDEIVDVPPAVYAAIDRVANYGDEEQRRRRKKGKET